MQQDAVMEKNRAEEKGIAVSRSFQALLCAFFLMLLLLPAGKALGAPTAAAAEVAAATETAAAAAGETESREGQNVQVTVEGPLEGIELDLRYGYQNTAKSGRFLPVTLEIENGTEQDLSGVLSLSIPESGNVDMRYEYEVDAPAGKTTQVNAVISVTEAAQEALLQLYDTGGRLLAESRRPFHVQGSENELLIGILSNTPQELSYLRGISVANSELRTRTVSLNPADFPETEEGLSQLDLMVISNYNMGRLSEDALQMIYDWVLGGGMLLLGTGDSPEPLGELSEHLPGLEISPAETQMVNMGIRYSTDGPDGAMLELSVCQVYVPEGIQALQSDELAILTNLSVGSGTIGITAYDLCDIRRFCGEHPAYADDLLQALFGSARLKQLSSARSGSNDYEAIRELVALGDPDRNPNMTVYLAIAAVYVLLAGPGAFWFLRQKGLGIYYPFSVLLISSATAAAVWLAGLGTRFDGPFIEYASILEHADGKELETEFLNISTPRKEPFRLALSEDYLIQPVLAQEGAEQGEWTAETGGGIVIRSGPEGKTVLGNGLTPFSGQVFELYKSAEQETDQVELDIHYFDDSLSGTVTNRGEEDLEAVTLLMYGRIVSIGTLDAGETKDLSGYTAVYGPTNSQKLTAEYITGLDRLSQGSSAYAKALARTRLLSYYMEESLSSYYSGARLVAFLSTDRKDVSGIAGSSMESHGTTLLIESVPVDYRQGEEVYRSALSSEPKVISGAYEAGSNTTGGTASVILEYSLGNDLRVTSFKLNSLSEGFSGKMEESGQSLIPFRGTLAFYNYGTSAYDMISSSKSRWTEEEILPYLSPANTITVRYVPDENSAEGNLMFLPVPTVTGVEK